MSKKPKKESHNTKTTILSMIECVEKNVNYELVGYNIVSESLEEPFVTLRMPCPHVTATTMKTQTLEQNLNSTDSCNH